MDRRRREEEKMRELVRKRVVKELEEKEDRERNLTINWGTIGSGFQKYCMNVRNGLWKIELKRIVTNKWLEWLVLRMWLSSGPS